ncbi:MAG: STAS/SEC14 domain-containing protein [Pseudomonadota bacterium]
MNQITEFAPHAFELVLKEPMKGGDIQHLEEHLAPYALDEGAACAVIDISWLRGNALAEDSQLGRLMDQLDKFGRVAVVSNGEEMGATLDAIHCLMPTGSFARFSTAEKSEARAFAATLYHPVIQTRAAE